MAVLLDSLLNGQNDEILFERKIGEDREIVFNKKEILSQMAPPRINMVTCFTKTRHRDRNNRTIIGRSNPRIMIFGYSKEVTSWHNFSLMCDIIGPIKITR